MTDWKTVPTEATPEIEAGSRAVCKSNGTDSDRSFDGIRAWTLENCVSIPVWEAMLAASPPAPAAEPVAYRWHRHGVDGWHYLASLPNEPGAYFIQPLYTHPLDAAAIRAEARR